MSRLHRLGPFFLSLVAVVALAACGDELAPTQANGSLSLGLQLAPGVEIDEVRWEITGGDMAPMSGTINTSAPGATASVEVFGLPPGDDYLVDLLASSGEGGAVCSGDAPFEVRAGETTDVMVFLKCKLGERFGGVRVNGELNSCADLAKVVVSPLQTAIGNEIDLSATASDLDGDLVSYFWDASGGPIDDRFAPTTTYTCRSIGEQLIYAAVSDDDFRDCIDEWIVPVTCVGDGGGSGGTGGGGGMGGGGGIGACTNPEDASIYNDLVYVDSAGVTTFGTDAAAAIASDCVFGSASSEPPNPGCGTEAGAVLTCTIRGSCTEGEIAALSACVSECQQDLVFEITGSTLTAGCSACYGATTSCSAALCATAGCSNPNSTACIKCRCEEGCIPGFEACSGIPDDTCDGGGTGGSGGGGGTGGFGGFGGGGGTGGTSIDPLCEPQSQSCTDGSIGAYVPCCDQVVPDQPSACQGDESLTNPTSCTMTGTTISYQWTVIETARSCNTGYNLDGCDGVTCIPGALAPFEGLDGVDNALTGLAPTLEGVGSNLSGVDQAFSDGICGLSDDPEQGICVGGENDGGACTSNLDCPGFDTFCQLDDGDCQIEIPPIDIRFIVDANFEENCANVRIDSSGDISDVIVNLGDLTNDGTACMSGAFGAVPLTLVGVPSVLANVLVRTTISEAGFTDGLMGSTVDERTAVTIAELLLEGGGAIVSQALDINEDLAQDTSAVCNAISTAFTIGGVTVETLP